VAVRGMRRASRATAIRRRTERSDVPQHQEEA
jgi:hypothetical protein